MHRRFFFFFFLIPIRKALDQHISKMTYCSLAVYFHTFTLSFYSFPSVFTRQFTKMGILETGDYRGFGAVFHPKEDSVLAGATVL